MTGPSAGIPKAHRAPDEIARQEQAARSTPCGFLPPMAAFELQAASLTGTTGSPERISAVNAAARFVRRTYPDFFRNEAHASHL